MEMRVSSENSRCFPVGSREESKRTGTISNILMLGGLRLALYVIEKFPLACFVENKILSSENKPRRSSPWLIPDSA